MSNGLSMKITLQGPSFSMFKIDVLIKQFRLAPQQTDDVVENIASGASSLKDQKAPLLKNITIQHSGLAEENNNDKPPNASFQDDDLFNSFLYTDTRKLLLALEEFGFSLPTQNTSLFQSIDGRVENGFLNGPLKGWRFMLLKPEGFVDPDHPEESTLLRKLLWIKARLQAGLQIHQSPKGIFINQAKYALEILKKHNMDNCHSIGTPLATKPKLDVDLSGEPVDQSDYHSKIWSLMYLTSSRPDLVQADSGFELTAFSDADHAGCLDTRKSTSRGIQFLGDKLVSWMSKKQNYTAMSSVEAEYVALSASCAQVMWMRTQLQDYGFNYNKIPLYCDSQSAIAISCNPVQHSRTKHIHTRYHFIKEQVENGIIELYFVRTEYQLADMFTKALPEDRFKYLVRRIGMRCLTPAELEVLTNESA
ncbi:hypothetical protein Tco_0503648 [Tanacetum coccineum]